MAEFEFKCPQCGETVITDESDCGQVAACPFCGKGIVVPKSKTRKSTPNPCPVLDPVRSTIQISTKIDQKEGVRNNPTQIYYEKDIGQTLLPILISILRWLWLKTVGIGCLALLTFLMLLWIGSDVGSILLFFGLSAIGLGLLMFSWLCVLLYLGDVLRHQREIRDELKMIRFDGVGM